MIFSNEEFINIIRILKFTFLKPRSKPWLFSFYILYVVYFAENH